MANKLILKRSSVASKVPLATDLEPGELAVNLADQKLYSKKSDGTVILVGSGLGGAGSVTSVGLSAPTGFSVSGSPVTTSGTLALSFASGYSLPTNAKQTEWDSAYSQRLQWDGGATNLVAATGRASLGLGSLATLNSVEQANLAANVAGNGPMFRAVKTSGVTQTLSAATFTKIIFGTETIDSNSNYDPSNSRFTPTVAGFYMFSGGFEVLSAQASFILELRINTSTLQRMYYAGSAHNGAWGTSMYYLNGSTDYVELYGWSSQANLLSNSEESTYFQGSLVRAAL